MAGTPLEMKVVVAGTDHRELGVAGDQALREDVLAAAVEVWRAERGDLVLPV